MTALPITWHFLNPKILITLPKWLIRSQKTLGPESDDRTGNGPELYHTLTSVSWTIKIFMPKLKTYIVGLHILWSVVPFLVGRLVRYWSVWPLISTGHSFIQRPGDDHVTRYQSSWVLFLYQCHPTFMVNENEKAMNGSKRQNYGNRVTISQSLTKRLLLSPHSFSTFSHGIKSNSIFSGLIWD